MLGKRRPQNFKRYFACTSVLSYLSFEFNNVNAVVIVMSLAEPGQQKGDLLWRQAEGHFRRQWKGQFPECSKIVVQPLSQVKVKYTRLGVVVADWSIFSLLCFIPCRLFWVRSCKLSALIKFCYATQFSPKMVWKMWRGLIVRKASLVRSFWLLFLSEVLTKLQLWELIYICGLMYVCFCVT